MGGQHCQDGGLVRAEPNCRRSTATSAGRYWPCASRSITCRFGPRAHRTGAGGRTSRRPRQKKKAAGEGAPAPREGGEATSCRRDPKRRLLWYPIKYPANAQRRERGLWTSEPPSEKKCQQFIVDGRKKVIGRVRNVCLV